MQNASPSGVKAAHERLRPKGLDQAEMRRKREATTVQIRKDKKEDNLQKRRRDIGGGSSSAVRSDSRPGTAQESPRATTLRHPVERQLVERSVDNTLAWPASG